MMSGNISCKTKIRVQTNILDPIHNQLDQRLFKGIDPRPATINFIKKKIYEVLDGIIHPSEQYFDLYLTGSITTYQYSDGSDCDISIFPRYDKLEAKFKTDAKEIRKRIIVRVINHLDGLAVPGTPFVVQGFVTLPGDKPADMYRAGMRSAWSFQTHKWIVPPEKDRVHDVQHELPLVYLRAHAIGEKMKQALTQDPKAAIKLYKQVHLKRSNDQRAGRGDFSEGNVMYKYLAHEGYFDRLRDIGLHIAKVAEDAPDTDSMQVIYNFQSDRIILGSKAESATLPNTILVGTYKNGDVTLNEAVHQWMNTRYFKKLWLESFPTYPLYSVHIHHLDGNKHRLAEQLKMDLGPAEREYPGRYDIIYEQAFIYLGQPFNQLITYFGGTMHSELMDECFTPEMYDAPMVMGHIGKVAAEYQSWNWPAYDRKPLNPVQWVAMFGSHAFQNNQQENSLRTKAMIELNKSFPGIKDITDVSTARWWTQAFD